ncbi:adenylyl-sulfate kinase [Castellaniella hirudinis]|uniref:Adenylyl-sulfate kinase n=1 Tax=Castellaniella hirudinis TaxID=1144617 RepID=A0ABV8RZQ0_9BURK
MKNPTIIWITGYSGSGKTTVGRKVNFLLNQNGTKSVFLDGDDLRSVLGEKWGYTKEERIALAHSYFRLSNLLMAQGLTVVISAVAMYHDVYAWIKTNVDRSLVVYLDVPEEERRARDRATKNVYEKIGNTQQLYDDPSFADLKVKNSGETTPETSAEMILSAIHTLPLAADRSDKGRGTHWNTYYSEGRLISEPSSFALLVMPQVPQKARLLEIGCGNGRDSLFFSSQGLHVTAIDPSQAAIDVCRSTPGSDSIEFIHGTVDQLTEAHAEKFDAAYSRFCLHAMTEAEEISTLDQVRAALRPKASFYIECRSINDPLARQGEVISPTERIHGHYRRFIVLDELKARLDQAGFDILWSEEADNVASLSGDNPVVIRLAALRR